MPHKKGIIYLIQPKELIGTQRYKVGHSGKTDLSRLRAYRKGKRVLHVSECFASVILEDKIKALFKREFELIAGSEYFEGDERKMIRLFTKEVLDHMDLFDEDGNDLVEQDEEKEEEDERGDGKKRPSRITRVGRVKKASKSVKRASKSSKDKEIDMQPKFVCDNCNTPFQCKRNMQRHIDNDSCKVKNFDCKYCIAKFTTKNSMYRHMKHACKEKPKE